MRKQKSSPNFLRIRIQPGLLKKKGKEKRRKEKKKTSTVEKIESTTGGGLRNFISLGMLFSPREEVFNQITKSKARVGE